MGVYFTIVEHGNMQSICVMLSPGFLDLSVLGLFFLFNEELSVSHLH